MEFLIEKAIKIGKTLIVSDLHIGLDAELLKSGIKIPSQTEHIFGKLKKIIKNHKIDRIIFLGDIKHEFASPTRKELVDVKTFLYDISKLVKEAIVLKGNHDGNIEFLCPNAMKVLNEFNFKGYGMFHGNAWFSEKLLDCKILITSHMHPSIEFDYGFTKFSELVWVIAKPNKKFIEKKFGRRCKIEKIIVMPPFNDILSGIPLNSKNYKANSIVEKISNFKEADIFLADGTKIGKLKDLANY